MIKFNYNEKKEGFVLLPLWEGTTYLTKTCICHLVFDSWDGTPIPPGKIPHFLKAIS